MMVDFFFDVGAPDQTIDHLNTVGALMEPPVIGSWITMSKKAGMDGGWFFPSEVPLEKAIRVVPAVGEQPANSQMAGKIEEWMKKHELTKVQSVARDMGASPPRQSALWIKIPKEKAEAIFRDAVEVFGVKKEAWPLEKVIEILKMPAASETAIELTVSTQDEVVNLALMAKDPTPETVKAALAVDSESDKHRTFYSLQGVFNSQPEWVEFSYLATGYGYGVYEEGFNVGFMFDVGREKLQKKD